MKLLPATLFVLLSLFVLPVSGVSVLAPEEVYGQEHAEEHHEGAHDAHGHHIGGPEHEPPIFDPKNWRFDLSVYSLVVFLLLLAVLTKFAWNPILTALEERETSIRKNVEDAEAARVRAEQLLAERAKKLELVQDEVREILAEARRDAEHTKAEIMASAQKEAEASKRRAIDEIDRARDQALNELFNTMSAQVTKATEQVIGRAISQEDRVRLIDNSLAELTARN